MEAGTRVLLAWPSCALRRAAEAVRTRNRGWGRAVEIGAARPEGHFWLAANMGTLAESFGFRAGWRYRGPVRRELETVLSIDPSYGEGLADRTLGRWSGHA